MQISDEMVEAARKAFIGQWNGVVPFDTKSLDADMRAALEAVVPVIRATALEEERKRLSDPHAADWYWRDLDPDDNGESINNAIHMMGEGVVCAVSSSFRGPSFFAAIVPVLEPESDDTEEITADTQEECVRLVKERYAAIRAMKEPT